MRFSALFEGDLKEYNSELREPTFSVILYQFIHGFYLLH
jgi:hypothetical protein